MKTYRPKRITIRLTEEEHQALSELRHVHGGSYQGVLMDALHLAYSLYDHAESIRIAKHAQFEMQLWRNEPDVPFDDETARAWNDYYDGLKETDIPV